MTSIRLTAGFDVSGQATSLAGRLCLRSGRATVGSPIHTFCLRLVRCVALHAFRSLTIFQLSLVLKCNCDILPRRIKRRRADAFLRKTWGRAASSYSASRLGKHSEAAYSPTPVIANLSYVRLALAAQRKQASTTLQKLDLSKRAAPILREIHRFLELQATYMPGLTSQAEGKSTAAPTQDNVDVFPILLPSDLEAATRASLCVDGLIAVEDDLQNADAYEALDELRHTLRIRTAYNRAKVKNVTGQVPNTRAREKQASADQAVHSAKHRYRAARSALERLRGSGEWEKTLRPLLDKDVVGLGERALSREELAENERVREMGGMAADDSVPLSGVVSVGEGRRTLSWIWYTSSNGWTVNEGVGRDWDKVQRWSSDPRTSNFVRTVGYNSYLVCVAL